MKTTFNILMGLTLASMTLAAAADNNRFEGPGDNGGGYDTLPDAPAEEKIEMDDNSELIEVLDDNSELIEVFEDENGFSYAINEDGVSATFYGTKYKDGEDVTVEGFFKIPAVINLDGTDYPVTEIGECAFRGCVGLTSVDIPASVTTIVRDAFSGCVGLTSVTIPASVTAICWGAFSDCVGLTSVDIPASVTEIGDGAFSGCVGLTSVDIPASVTVIGYRAFARCSGLTKITVDKRNPFYDSRDNCNAIIESATNALIAGCKSTHIPASVTKISLDAFLGCIGLTSVDIPSSVTEIGRWAFSGCSGLTKITVDKRNPFYDSRDNCNAIIESATNALIAGCKSTHIPASVTEIGWGAFSGCIGLTSVDIPSSVREIGYKAFAGCSGLTSVTIPASVTAIGDWAFADCESMKAIRCLIADPDEVEIGDDVFDGVDSSSCVLYVPKQSVERYKALEPWNGFTIRALPE